MKQFIKTKLNSLQELKNKPKRLLLASTDIEYYLYSHVSGCNTNIIQLSINDISSKVGIMHFSIDDSLEALKMAIQALKNKKNILSFLVLDKVDTLIIGINR